MLTKYGVSKRLRRTWVARFVIKPRSPLSIFRLAGLSAAGAIAFAIPGAFFALIAALAVPSQIDAGLPIVVLAGVFAAYGAVVGFRFARGKTMTRFEVRSLVGAWAAFPAAIAGMILGFLSCYFVFGYVLFEKHSPALLSGAFICALAAMLATVTYVMVARDPSRSDLLQPHTQRERPDRPLPPSQRPRSVFERRRWY